MENQKVEMIQWIKQAVKEGARQSKACQILGISTRTLQCWRNLTNLSDRRCQPKKKPSNALSELETKLIIQTANKPEYAKLSSTKIVPALFNHMGTMRKFLIISCVKLGKCRV